MSTYRGPRSIRAPTKDANQTDRVAPGTGKVEALDLGEEGFESVTMAVGVFNRLIGHSRTAFSASTPSKPHVFSK